MITESRRIHTIYMVVESQKIKEQFLLLKSIFISLLIFGIII